VHTIIDATPRRRASTIALPLTEAYGVIIQTAPAGTPRLAIMMYEHTALCLHFAHAFGNERFEPLNPLELMIHVISHHDAGWFDFDRDPQIDPATHLPYNLAETPPAFITETSRGSPEFNQRQHAYCGLISSMHSLGASTTDVTASPRSCCSTRSRRKTGR
jgi:hypothetical protein